ncbi:PFL family protein [Singulisphaera sp. Ch08]|uniref:PFL family protein n=1 Tax=Singulisphaera sp. Ch08 TaxID=3120278 RepID=A0AAU7CNP8_9BACT
MHRTEDVLSTLGMIRQHKLDVRTVTMGIDLQPCASPDITVLCDRIRQRLLRFAGRLRAVCLEVEGRYGIPIVNRRIAVSPIAAVAAGHTAEGYLAVARTLDAVAAEVEVDLVGGFTALVQKGSTDGDRRLIEALPEVLSTTQRVCASVNVGTTAAGINMDAILALGHVLKDTAERTRDHDGFGCAKLVIFANAPTDNPFMAGAFHGVGEPDCVINIGVSGPGVVKAGIEDLLAHASTRLTLGEIAEEIKSTAFRVTRVGELIGREVASRLGVPFGIVDLSLAPTPQVGDSVGEILQAMGVVRIGAPGSTAALALLNDAVKKGGSFASSSVGGLSGAFVAVSEDSALAKAVEVGDLTLAKLEAMTAVCSVGLDMIAVPGDTDAETLAALIADEVAIGVINHKTTAVRVIPVPGKVAGERAVFGGLFGEMAILPIHAAGGSTAFVRHGGRIPAPLSSLRN